MATPAQLERLKKHWEQQAKESLKVEEIGGAFYAFGSELACLRLYLSYKGNKKTDCAYSQNLHTFYFKLET